MWCVVPLCDNFSAHGGFTKGTTLIHFAVFLNKPEAIKIIVPYMENPTAPDSDGETPIQCAERLGRQCGIHIQPSSNVLRKMALQYNECVKILKTYQ